MNWSELIESFRDTLRIAESEKMAEQLESAKASTRVYPEGYRAPVERPLKKNARITVEESTSFAAANQYRHMGKTAVLNFANPVTPGGGVQYGAMAQEECLCRSSNLYLCLTASPFPDYYGYHAAMNDPFYSDRLLYTRGVTVFKNEDEIPKLLPEKDWFQVDVITCAAPYLSGKKYINREALKTLFKSRIKNIFEAALENGAEVLILGAFGCGAFKNPPDVVAMAFREVITENKYDRLFGQIVFAIKKSADRINYQAFLDAFCTLTVNYPVYTLDKISLPSKKELPEMTVRFPRTPANMTPDRIEEWIADGRGEPEDPFLPDAYGRALHTEYIKWKVKNPYYKKRFSILGDSISTLEGYVPEGYKVFYAGDTCQRAGVQKMEDTWWGKVIAYFGGELLVNDSWSGSPVSKILCQTPLFPAGCSDERIEALRTGPIAPDVIIVYFGTDEWNGGAKTDGKYINGSNNCGVFSAAYRLMLAKLKQNYPSADIFCCTLNETRTPSDPASWFPHAYGGTHIEEYNTAIRNAVSEAGCRLIDLYRNRIPYDSIDGFHPNADGMDTLAVLMLRAMCGPEGAAFLNCEAGHDFIVAEKYTGGSERVCRKCGLVRRDLALPGTNGEIEEFLIKAGRAPTVNYKYGDGVLTGYHSVDDVFSGDEDIWYPCGFFEPVQVRLTQQQRQEVHAMLQSFPLSAWQAEPGDPNERDAMGRSLASFSCRFENGTFFSTYTRGRMPEEFEQFMRFLESVCPLPRRDSESVPDLEEPEIIDLDRERTVILFSAKNGLQLSRGHSAETVTMKMNRISIGSDKSCDICLDDPEVSAVHATLSFSRQKWLVQDNGSASGTWLNNIRLEPGKKYLLRPDDEIDIGHKESFILFSSRLGQKRRQEPTGKGYFASSLAARDWIGTQIAGRYKITAELGHGLFSTVFLAKDMQDTAVCKDVAAKICPSEESASDLSRDSLLREADLLRRIDHPAIPKYIDLIENEGYLILIREYIDGYTLSELAARNGKFPEKQVINMGLALAEILDVLHSFSPPYIYCDMNPNNIILTGSGEIKLIDFGSVRSARKEKGEENTVLLGTQYYAAPEQYRGQFSPRSDLYSLGMTMWTLLTGVSPSVAAPPAMRPVRQIDPSLSAGIETILQRCTAVDPQGRYPSCKELMKALRKVKKLPSKHGFLNAFRRKGKS